MTTTTKEALCFELLCDEVSKRLREDDRAPSDEDVANALFGDKQLLTYKDLEYHLKWGARRIDNMVIAGVITPIRAGRNASFSAISIIAAIRRGLSTINQPTR